jgi:hypothetical protein
VKLTTETGTEPVEVATGLPACYRKQFRIRVELLFGHSRAIGTRIGTIRIQIGAIRIQTGRIRTRIGVIRTRIEVIRLQIKRNWIRILAIAISTVAI